MRLVGDACCRGSWASGRISGPLPKLAPQTKDNSDTYGYRQDGGYLVLVRHPKGRAGATGRNLRRMPTGWTRPGTAASDFRHAPVVVHSHSEVYCARHSAGDFRVGACIITSPRQRQQTCSRADALECRAMCPVQAVVSLQVMRKAAAILRLESQ